MNKKIISFSLIAIIVVAGSIVVFNLFNRSSEKTVTKVDAILIKATPEEIVKQSDGIIIGTVESLQVVKAPSDLRTNEDDIVTNANILVEKYLFNPKNLSLPKVTVQTIGGTIDNKTMISEDSPIFQKGEKVIVFLHQKNDTTFTVYGWSQGKYTILNDKLADNQNERDIFKSIFGKEMTITEFEKQIELLVLSIKK